MRPPFKLGDLLAAAAAAAAAAVISSKDLCRSSQRSSRRWTAEERLGGRRKGERRCNYFHGLDNYVSSSSAIAGGELSPSCFCTSSSSSCVFFRTFVFAPLLPSFPHPFPLLTYHHTDAIEEKKTIRVGRRIHFDFAPPLFPRNIFRLGSRSAFVCFFHLFIFALSSLDSEAIALLVDSSSVSVSSSCS